MTITATRKFFVTDGPVPPNLGIANINQAGYDPTDRDRLAIHYNPAAGKINLNAQNDMYGRSNIMGGNYTFDPAGDYLNAGGWDGSHTNPIHPLGSGLDNALSPATGAGGALFGDNLRVGIPRVSAGDSSAAGSIQCPYGFYQFNNVCVPGVNLDPTNPNNALGINVGNASYQEAKGVILQVIPPVKTAKGQLFQVVTQIQNIGHKAGKFYTKVSVPMIGLQDVQSNGAFLDSGQKGVVYQSLQMPTSIPDQSLLTVKSDLYKQALDNPSAPEQIQDSNTANLPTPDTVLGMPPIRPPVPQFPISTGNTQGFGYPYNPPNPGPAMPTPPPPPGYGGPYGNPLPPPGFSGPFSPFNPYQFGTPFHGFSARANFGEFDYPPQQQFFGQPDPYYGYQDPYAQYGYPQDPYAQYYGYQQPTYDASQFNYQQYQYTGDPNYNPTPPPFPIYGDAASPLQQNMYYGNYQYPYQYQTPPIYDNPQPQTIPLPDIPDPEPTPAPHPIINIQGGGGAAGGSITTDPVTGITTIIGGGSGDAAGGTITTGGHSPIVGQGNNIDDNEDNLAQQIVHRTQRKIKHDNKSHSHKKKKHHSNFAFPFDFGGGFAEPVIRISPHTQDNNYSVGQRISVSINGFAPGEWVVIQLYIIKSFLGTWRFTQKIGNTYARVGQSGRTNPKAITIPNLRGRTLAIVAIGMYSGHKVHTKITIR